MCSNHRLRGTLENMLQVNYGVRGPATLKPEPGRDKPGGRLEFRSPRLENLIWEIATYAVQESERKAIGGRSIFVFSGLSHISDFYFAIIISVGNMLPGMDFSNAQQ